MSGSVNQATKPKFEVWWDVLLFCSPKWLIIASSTGNQEIIKIVMNHGLPGMQQNLYHFIEG